MTRGSIFALLATILASLPAVAQTQTDSYKPGVTPEGATYFLPKTAVRITVQIEKSTYTPGDFCQYAQRYLRLNDVKSEPMESYRVVAVSQEPIGVADATKAYTVKFNPRTSAVNVALSNDGVLLAINAKPNVQDPIQPYKAAPRKMPVNPRQYMTEEILAAGSTAKMAELTAREIYDLRENRSLLVKGQADFMPKDGKQLQLMLDELAVQDAALTSLFAGTVTRDTTEQVLTVCPKGASTREVLMRFSEKLGLRENDDLSGTPYYIYIEELNGLPPMDEAAAQKRKKVENGLYVNVPGKMRSTIFCGNEQVAQAEMPAAQFGYVELLAGSLFNKHYDTRLWLNPITGGVEKLEAAQPK